MTKEEFLVATEIMADCLPTARAENRISGLYHFFKDETFETIRLASEAASKDEQHFPTPTRFKFYVLANRGGKDRKQVPCDFCGGYGVVSARKSVPLSQAETSYTFRCHCPNAAQFQNIPPWTKDHRGHYMLENPYQDIGIEPAKYKNGLAYLKANGVTVPKRVIDKIESKLRAAKDLEEPPF